MRGEVTYTAAVDETAGSAAEVAGAAAEEEPEPEPEPELEPEPVSLVGASSPVAQRMAGPGLTALFSTSGPGLGNIVSTPSLVQYWPPMLAWKTCGRSAKATARFSLEAIARFALPALMLTTAQDM